MSAFPIDPVDVTDPSGAVVISIAELREARRISTPPSPPECQHARIGYRELEAEVICRDCQTRLNPVAWIAWAGKRWWHIQRQYRAMKLESDRLDLRRRVVCRKCGDVTPLVGRPEDERKRKETREAHLVAALEHISVLIPEAAARSAAEIARKALVAERAPASPPQDNPPPHGQEPGT